MLSRYKVMCGYEYCISAKSMHSSLPSWRDCCFKKTQESHPKCSKQKVWGKTNNIYETYKNTVITHGHHIYDKSYDMSKETIRA